MKTQHLSDRRNASVNSGQFWKLHTDLLSFLSWLNDHLQYQHLDATAWHSFGIAQPLAPLTQQWIRFDLIAPNLERVTRELANARNGLNSLVHRRAVMANNDRIGCSLEVEDIIRAVREHILSATREMEIMLLHAEFPRAEMSCLY